MCLPLYSFTIGLLVHANMHTWFCHVRGCKIWDDHDHWESCHWYRAPYYWNLILDKVLTYQEEEDKWKNLTSCLEKLRHFVPHVCSVDGILGWEANAFNRRIAQHITHQWDNSYSHMCGYINVWIIIMLLRATCISLWESRVPDHRMSRHR